MNEKKFNENLTAIKLKFFQRINIYIHMHPKKNNNNENTKILTCSFLKKLVVRIGEKPRLQRKKIKNESTE